MTSPEEEQAAALADRLLDAHRALREADLPAEDKGRAARRLIALTDASKHDVARAAARLEAFLADLQAGRVAPASSRCGAAGGRGTRDDLGSRPGQGVPRTDGSRT